ncbi:MAG: cyclic nucleotide-binding domain-containing protein [Planctomycetaceae bacterium]|nr:cyclic nucleotide-binding domain-containing protein [Planctomycetaceae bacterium]
MTKTHADLECCALFNGLNREGLTSVFELVKSEAFASGSDILQQGLTYQSVWAVLRGRCEVVRMCGEDRHQQLAILEPGGIFGEMSFFQDVPHSATVRAMTDVDTVRITPAAFDRLKAQSPHAAFVIVTNLVRLLSDRLRRMDNWTCDLVDRSTDGRHHAEWREFQSKLYTDWSF